MVSPSVRVALHSGRSARYFRQQVGLASVDCVVLIGRHGDLVIRGAAFSGLIDNGSGNSLQGIDITSFHFGEKPDEA